MFDEVVEPGPRILEVRVCLLKGDVVLLLSGLELVTSFLKSGGDVGGHWGS